MAIGTIISRVLEGGAKVLDEVVTNKEEMQQLLNEIKALAVKDRESAREMYKVNSSLQKWFALVFMVAYMAMTLAAIYFIYKASCGVSVGLDVPEWGVAFLSTLFGAMSAKVSTICDFLFGGSMSANDAKK